MGKNTITYAELPCCSETNVPDDEIVETIIALP